MVPFNSLSLFAYAHSQLPRRGSLWDVPYKLTYSLPVEGGGFCEAKAGGVEKRKKLRLLSSTPPSAYFNSLLMHRRVSVFQFVLFGILGKVRLIAGVVAALNGIKIFVRIELASVYFRYAYGNV